ncbi:recombinase family protein, partial [Staphylococcus epidermidis]|uniref:recombinase family protein n=1 Tax=Staphylococcus epidermidis TaxID=1282 RepID=UPI0011A19B6B
MQTTQPYTIHAQINQIKQYSHFHHFHLKHIYPHPPISPKSINPPHLQPIFKHPKQPNIHSLILYKTNPLPPNTSHLLKILQHFHKQNLQFFTLSQPIQLNTSSPKLILHILPTFSEFQPNNILHNLFIPQTTPPQEGYYQ